MKNKPLFLYINYLLAIGCCALLINYPASAQIKNFNKDGGQAVRFSTAGNAIDAHDGEIAYFNGTYYLYGTSYDCGFQWGNKVAPFCGFKSYSSKDLVNWTDRGFLFDAGTPLWQSRCDGKTYGCFRPHVIFNKKNAQYVLWINVYDNTIGYRVFTAKTPTGPFTEVAEPRLAVNNNMPAAGLNNGDHDTFVDDDGTAYLAYTDWRAKGSIVIEKLSADYLTGTGQVVKAVTTGETEAPGLFKRNGIYYLTYSDPNCGYCAGTGTSYRTAKSPLGPWSEGKKISDNSCGGQPSFVSTIKINSNTVYLYGSDLWNNAAKNEALANFYWAPLTFANDGSINPLQCMDAYKLPKAARPAIPKNLDNSSGTEDFTTKCDINGKLQRAQMFSPKHSGKLTRLNINVFKNDYPDAPLQVQLYKADRSGQPVGTTLFKKELSPAAIGWSAKNISFTPGLKVMKGDNYVIVLKSDANKGCYGVAVNEHYPNGGAAVSIDNGKTFTDQPDQAIKFQTFVVPATAKN